MVNHHVLTEGTMSKNEVDDILLTAMRPFIRDFYNENKDDMDEVIKFLVSYGLATNAIDIEDVMINGVKFLEYVSDN